ncbi:MAG: hypothetical protein ACK4ZN_07575 [Oceanibaculum sp.]
MSDREAKQRFAEDLERLMDLSGKPRKKIAVALGYDNANVISMFKKGTTKVPFNRIPALARVLEVDPKWLFFRAMKEYEPDLIEVIAEIYGQIITDNERRLLEVVREETEFQNPRLDADREQELRQLLHKWRMKDEVELLNRGGNVSR